MDHGMEIVRAGRWPGIQRSVRILYPEVHTFPDFISIQKGGVPALTTASGQ